MYCNISEPVQDVFPLNTTWINEQQKLWVEGKELSILVVGRSGTGKSTLINWLFGRKEEQKLLKLFNEKKRTFVSENLTIEDVPLLLMFWNSPKPADVDSVEAEAVRDVDLIVYTLKMSEPRFQPEDVTIMRTLVDIFGTGFLNKAVFVLTFANQVGSVEMHELKRNKGVFESKMDSWKNLTIEKLETISGVKKLGSIPSIVAVGCSTEPMLFDKDWTTEVLKAFLSQLEDANHPALVKICKQHFVH